MKVKITIDETGVISKIEGIKDAVEKQLKVNNPPACEPEPGKEFAKKYGILPSPYWKLLMHRTPIGSNMCRCRMILKKPGKKQKGGKHER